MIHGTTLVTNAIVEDRVEPVALLATRGFEDMLEIGRAGRQHLYRLDCRSSSGTQVPLERRIGLPSASTMRGTSCSPPTAAR